jgi:flagellar basal-body rod protein FlgF
MDNAGYASLTRQSGLMREMQTLANNIANISTTGFRREGVLFSEFVRNGSTAARRRCRWPRQCPADLS